MNTFPFLTWSAVFLAAGVIAALLAVLLHKMLRMHRMLYRVAEDAAEARTEAGALFGQLQALAALERALALDGPLPPLRGWAGSPDFLLATYEQVRARRPQTVVECSSGSSTLVIARSLQNNGSGHLWSLEHEARYAEATRSLLRRNGLEAWATVLHAPLQTTHTATPWYREEALPADLPPIDLLVIDGPPQSVAPRARAPALPRLAGRMADAFAVLVDDADRPDEQAMVDDWLREHSGLEVTRIPAEKGLALVERKGRSAQSAG